MNATKLMLVKTRNLLIDIYLKGKSLDFDKDLRQGGVFEELHTAEEIILNAARTPKNTNDLMLRKSIYMHKDEFISLAEEISEDEEAVYIDGESVIVTDNARAALEIYFGVKITSIHQDGFYNPGMWISYVLEKEKSEDLNISQTLEKEIKDLKNNEVSEICPKCHCTAKKFDKNTYVCTSLSCGHAFGIIKF